MELSRDEEEGPGVVGLDVTGKVLESLLQPGLELPPLLPLGVSADILDGSAEGLYQAGTLIFSRDFLTLA